MKQTPITRSSIKLSTLIINKLTNHVLDGEEMTSSQVTAVIYSYTVRT